MNRRHAKELGRVFYWEGKTIDADPFPKYSPPLMHLSRAFREGYMDASERHEKRIEARKERGEG